MNSAIINIVNIPDKNQLKAPDVKKQDKSFFDDIFNETAEKNNSPVQVSNSDSNEVSVEFKDPEKAKKFIKKMIKKLTSDILDKDSDSKDKKNDITDDKCTDVISMLNSILNSLNNIKNNNVINIKFRINKSETKNIINHDTVDSLSNNIKQSSVDTLLESTGKDSTDLPLKIKSDSADTNGKQSMSDISKLLSFICKVSDNDNSVISEDNLKLFDEKVKSIVNSINNSNVNGNKISNKGNDSKNADIVIALSELSNGKFSISSVEYHSNDEKIKDKSDKLNDEFTEKMLKQNTLKKDSMVKKTDDIKKLDNDTGKLSSNSNLKFDQLVSNNVNKSSDTFDIKTEANNILNKVTDEISQMKPDLSKEVVVRLKPDFLGKLSIRVYMDKTGLTAKIMTDNKNVDSFLNDHIQDLKAILSQKELDLKSIDIKYDNHSMMDLSQFTGQSFNQNNQSSRNFTNSFYNLQTSGDFTDILAGNEESSNAANTVNTSGSVEYFV